MTAIEVTDGVQFTVDHKGSVTGVMLPLETWQRIVEALEDSEDRALVQKALPRLLKGPVTSNALLWDDIAESWR